MSLVFSWLLVAVAGLLAIPVGLFCLEIIAASFLRPQRRSLPANGARQRIAVLVPAHDEETGLPDTLADIKAQLRKGDRILVVADNCTDDTAAVAKAAGAEVTERRDSARVGKGYALAWGIDHLRLDAPDIVIIIDADCRLADGSVDRLAEACAASGAPVQALNLMIAPDRSSKDYRVAIFAFRIKNWVRPLGLDALNLPCQLTGTGMAFPWEVINSADLATGLAVEDMKLGLDLAQAGHSPVFCASAKVISQFPTSVNGAMTQRRRWEHGHLGMIKSVPGLICRSLIGRNIPLAALTLDLAVPPLTVLGTLLTALVAASALGRMLGLASAALPFSAAVLGAYVGALLLCWLNFGRDVLPAASILSIAYYVAGKFPLYNQIFCRGQDLRWIRTDRGTR
jgi:cellulose synthase/poly-beta-1,6-N-acetylglucosamine synthase-like glycosyltransferase